MGVEHYNAAPARVEAGSKKHALADTGLHKRETSRDIEHGPLPFRRAARAAARRRRRAAHAGGLDDRLEFDDSGIWDESVQDAVLYALVGGEIAGAFWVGGETRVGRVLWQSIDASAAGFLTAETMKRVFTRVRPRDADDPDLWFEGGDNDSFPSGSMIAVTSIITPFVLEYRADHPAVYALELLPVYMAVGRLKAQAPWQTDVIAGFAIGTAWGVLAHRREQPFILNLLPDGVMVGWSRRF